MNDHDWQQAFNAGRAEAEGLVEALEEFVREYDGFEDGNGDPCATLARARTALAKYREEL